MLFDDRTCDVRAGLSWFAGRSLPGDLVDVAEREGLLVGGWVFGTGAADSGDDGTWSITRLRLAGRSLRAAAAAAQISMLAPGDRGWPAGTGCDELPCLWVRGSTELAGLLGTAVAVSGASTASERGLRLAAGLAADLARSGQTLVTTTDDGIDEQVTAAVLGLPAAHRLVVVTAGGLDAASGPAVAEKLPPVIQRGAVISMAPPGARPWRSRIRARNELLYRLAGAAVLVEAAAGSKHLRAARNAARGGQLVCAVPGPDGADLSAGCRTLISEGNACQVTSANDVLAAMAGHAGSRFLHTVCGIARHGDRPAWRIPPFQVYAASPAHAANAAIDVVLAPDQRPARLDLTVSHPAGGHTTIDIDLAA